MLKTNILHPGQCVFVDHFVCSSPGRLFTGFGKNKQCEMYAGGCLFVDTASKYVHVEMHVGLNSHETLAGKTKFERLLNDMGVGVQEYVSNNSTIFSSSAFAENLLSFRQTSHFAGSREPIIKMELQSGVFKPSCRWHAPSCSMQPSNGVLFIPPSCGQWQSTTLCGCTTTPPTPKLVWRQSISCPKPLGHERKLKNTHVWGCPIYALDPKIADGKKIPRWNTRSRQGIFVGFSRDHASNIPLILNLSSG